MNPTIKNILAVLAGAIIGGVVNGGLISISSSVIPPPDGAILTTMEGLKASMSLMEPKHFLMPFLAHALGTLVGAAIASYVAANNKLMVALVVGFLFFLGGFANVIMLPSPLWFTITDLVVAYIPMSWIGYKISDRFSN